MIYNDRVTLIKEVTKEGFLGEDVVEETPTVVPCYRGKLTHNQQMGLFGSYNQKAFKLHLQGIHKDIDKIEYKGTPRSFNSINYHHNSTVVIVE